VSTAQALRGFQESAIYLLLLFDVTRYTFKVAPQTDTFLEAAIITALFRGALGIGESANPATAAEEASVHS